MREILFFLLGTGGGVFLCSGRRRRREVYEPKEQEDAQVSVHLDHTHIGAHCIH